MFSEVSKDHWEPEREEKEIEIPFCPQGHDNPCAWRNACSYCERLCEEEVENIQKENSIRKAHEKRNSQEVDH